MVLSSRLGIDLAGGQGLGRDSTIAEVRTRAINETYSQHPGKRSRVIDHCEEVVVTLRERAEPAWRWEVVLRAYDDGVALRYRFPAQEGSQRLAIAGERTQIQLPGNAQAYALPLNSFTTSHEVRYQKKSVAEIPVEWLLGLPLLTELARDGLARGDGGQPNRLRGNVPGTRCRWRDHLGLPAIPTAWRAASRGPRGSTARFTVAGVHDRRQAGAIRRVGPRP